MAFFAGPIDTILKEKDFTLEKLLDEDELVVEAKKGREDLLQFLTQPDTIRKMIDYIVDEPATADEKVRMRYPVVAAEVLACEEDKIEKALLDHSDFGRFFAFFKANKVNVLLSNVVGKVLNALLETHADKVRLHLQATPTILTDLVNHLECSAVIEFFTKMISGPQSQVNWLANSNFVTALYSKASKENAARHTDALNAFQDILTSLTWESVLTQKFASAESLQVLFKHALEKDNISGFRIAMKVCTVLLQSLQTFVKEPEDEDDEDTAAAKPAKPDVTAAIKDLPPIVGEIIQNLDKMHEVLKKPSNKKMTSQEGKIFDSFGVHRICVLDTLNAVIEVGFISVARKLLESDILDTCWKLMFESEFNTFCHRSVDKLTQGCLELVGGASQVTFLKKVDLINKLVSAEKSNKEIEEKGKARAPRMPYLHQTGRLIQLIGETNEQVATYLQEISTWPEFSAMLTEEKKKFDELVSAKNLGTDDEANIFKPGQHYGDFDVDSEAYREGRDGDADDLALPDDVDMDSTNDFDDYDIDQAEILLTKQEVEAFA